MKAIFQLQDLNTLEVRQSPILFQTALNKDEKPMSLNIIYFRDKTMCALIMWEMYIITTTEHI